MHKYILTLVLLGSFLLSNAQLVKTRKEITEKYPDGSLYKKTIVVEKKNKYPDIYENYRRTVTTTYTYYKRKRLKSVERSVEKIGNVGAPCFFVRYSMKQYDELGRLVWHKKMRCDGKKEVVKHYDHDTGTETVSVTKRGKTDSLEAKNVP